MIILPGGEDEPEIAPDITDAMIEAGRRMDERRWSPRPRQHQRPPGRRPHRNHQRRRPQGRLEAADIITVDMDGRAVTPWGRPSVETQLHCQLYRLFPQLGAVVHGHSVAATVLSMADNGAS